MKLSDNIRGSMLLVAAMAAFSSNDIVIKSFAGELLIGQIVLVRGVIACLFAGIVAWRFYGPITSAVALNPRVMVRAVTEVAATILFITAIFNAPIADATAIMMFLPLALTLGASYFLGETIGWRRLAAVAVGFLGVMVIIRPGQSGFNFYLLFAVGTVLICVVRDLVTRRIAASIPSAHVTVIGLAVNALAGAGLAVYEGWQPITPSHYVLLTAAAFFMTAGNILAVSAMRTGEIAFISPFRYSILVFAMLGGIVFFSEYPDFYSLLGSLIIIVTGIYTLFRERYVRKQDINPPPVRT